jgi:hypothetical protein
MNAAETRHRRWCLAASLLAALACFYCHAACADRYLAERRDGATFTGDKLRDFHDDDGPRLDDERFFDSDQPVRMLRDTTLSPQMPAMFVELASGDRLAGKLVAASIAGVDVDHLLLSETLHSGQVRVRLDWVRKISTKRRPQRIFTPGFVELADGRQLAARSIRWEPDGVKLLTDDGIVAARYEKIVELHAAQDNLWLPPLPSAEFLDVETPVVLRLLTGQGEIFTVPRTMLREMKSSDYERRGFFAVRRRRPTRYATPQLATRPLWSLDTILLDPQSVAFATWLDPTELPLSLLPVVEVQEKRGVHHLPWQLQRSVLGEPLQCGDAVAELGVGMHSFTRLAFQLPPHAQSFTTRVGFHEAANDGGCVHLRIWRDNVEGSPLWEKQFFRGGDGLQQVGPLEITGAARLILEVDFADADRPRGADPLDIRDWIDWLSPIVTIDAERFKAQSSQLAQLVPELNGWSLQPEQLATLRLRPYWFTRGDHWAMAIDSDESLTFTRDCQPALHNGAFVVRATRDDSSGAATVLRVKAAGELLASTMNSDVATHDRHRFSERRYLLPQSIDSPLKLEIVTEPHKTDDPEIRGLVWGAIGFEPLVKNLPPSREPITPDVPLSTIVPVSATHDDEALELADGKLTSGKPLNIRGWALAAGYGVPTESDITYKLDPAWREFVAVIGLADGWEGAGPYQILLDGKVHWSSERQFDRHEPGEQISVPLPPGHETITLRLLGDNSSGAWAHAGFLSDAE